MTRSARPRRTLSALAATAAALALSLSACRDVAPHDTPQQLRASDGVEAQLVFSNLEPAPGDTFVVLLRVRRGAEVGAIASFTSRIAYDSLRVRFEGEQPLADSGMRVLNPVVGETRMAGIATHGFQDGRLIALRYTALSAHATSTLKVTFDELHATNRDDLRRVVMGAPVVDSQLFR